MPPVKKPPRQRRRHFIKEWRDYHKLTQEYVAEKIGISSTNLGRIENYKVPYNQDFLEEAAIVYGCQPWDLLNRDPRADDDPDQLNRFRKLKPEERDEALSYLEFQRSRGKQAG